MMRDEELAHIATLLAGVCSALILEAVIGFVLMLAWLVTTVN
jgi:hypothetical protein|eukprot:COSAG05_NODE_1607_length_4414_cov_2.784241_3_plen_42_part_00